MCVGSKSFAYLYDTVIPHFIKDNWFKNTPNGKGGQGGNRPLLYSLFISFYLFLSLLYLTSFFLIVTLNTNGIGE